MLSGLRESKQHCVLCRTEVGSRALRRLFWVGKALSRGDETARERERDRKRERGQDGREGRKG